MRSALRGAGAALVTLGLLGLAGCSEDNESGVQSDSAGKTSVDKSVPSDYSQLKPGQAQGGQAGYPGAKKGPGAGAPSSEPAPAPK